MVHFDPVELARWCAGHWQGVVPARVEGVGNDSRHIEPGQLYVALRGERLDGHRFVAEALRRGAAAALVDEHYAANIGAAQPLLVVADTGAALSDLARGHRARCRAMRVGVTGSVGKTSVKEMTADVLGRLGPVARTCGNWNNHIGLPLSLLRMQPDDRSGVFEVGMSRPGELAPLCELLRPEHGILTPIGPAHLVNFTDQAAIADEKATLLDALPAEGFAVLSVDDPWYGHLLQRVRSRLVRVSLEGREADFNGVWDPAAQGVLTVQERESGRTASYRMPLPGRYVADNALRAVALGRLCGLAPEAIAQALAGYRPPGMRWAVTSISGVDFINDAYNANPLSMRAALEAVQEQAAGRRTWLVLGGMYELGAQAHEAHRELGRFLAGRSWAGVVTFGSEGEWIADGARETGLPAGTQLVSCGDLAAVAEVLREQLVPGDLVLLKASRGAQLEGVLSLLSVRMTAPWVDL